MVDTPCEIHQRHLVQLRIRVQILEAKIRRNTAGIALVREAIQQEETRIARLKEEGRKVAISGR